MSEEIGSLLTDFEIGRVLCTVKSRNAEIGRLDLWLTSHATQSSHESFVISEMEAPRIRPISEAVQTRALHRTSPRLVGPYRRDDASANVRVPSSPVGFADTALPEGERAGPINKICRVLRDRNLVSRVARKDARFLPIPHSIFTTISVRSS